MGVWKSLHISIPVLRPLLSFSLSLYLSHSIDFSLLSFCLALSLIWLFLSTRSACPDDDLQFTATPFFFFLFPPPEFHFLELNISFQCFLFGLLLHHHPMIRPPPSPPSSSSCSSFAALWWMDWLFLYHSDIYLIGDSCGNCCFQYSHSVVHAKEVVAKSSIWVCPGSRDDEWFSHCILSCIYIYVFFLSKFFQELDFGGGAY